MDLGKNDKSVQRAQKSHEVATRGFFYSVLAGEYCSTQWKI